MERAFKFGLSTTPREITATDASNHFGALLDDVAGKVGHYVITRLGRPRAVMISIDEYREILHILETLEELDDAEYMAGIREAREDIALGRTMTLDELDEKLGLSTVAIGDSEAYVSTASSARTLTIPLSLCIISSTTSEKQLRSTL